MMRYDALFYNEVIKNTSYYIIFLYFSTEWIFSEFAKNMSEEIYNSMIEEQFSFELL